MAYLAEKRKDAVPVVMTDWKDGQRNEKAPTRIAYASENPELDQDVCCYEVHPGMKSYQWYKIWLDHSPSNVHFDDPLLNNDAYEIQGEIVPEFAFEKTRDTLKYVYDFAMETLQNQMEESVLAETPIKFYLTTPAMWSLKARSETRRAAEEAGYGSRESLLGISDELHIIDEPEAAAIAILMSTMDNLPGNNLQASTSKDMLCHLLTAIRPARMSSSLTLAVVPPTWPPIRLPH